MPECCICQHKIIQRTFETYAGKCRKCAESDEKYVLPNKPKKSKSSPIKENGDITIPKVVESTPSTVLNMVTNTITSTVALISAASELVGYTKAEEKTTAKIISGEPAKLQEKKISRRKKKVVPGGLESIPESGPSFSELKQTSLESLNLQVNSSIVQTVKTSERIKRKVIDLITKTQVWDKYIGLDIGRTKCPYCQANEITQLNFECGHVIPHSKGGVISVPNLRPICNKCNKSMGNNDMELSRYKDNENSVIMTKKLICLIRNSLEGEIIVDKEISTAINNLIAAISK